MKESKLATTVAETRLTVRALAGSSGDQGVRRMLTAGTSSQPLPQAIKPNVGPFRDDRERSQGFCKEPLPLFGRPLTLLEGFPEIDKLLGKTTAESLTSMETLTAQVGFTKLMKVNQWRVRN